VFYLLISFQNCTSGEKSQSKNEFIERGKYLVKRGGCTGCHTPKVFPASGFVWDTTRLLSGHPADYELPDIDRNRICYGEWFPFDGCSTVAVGSWGIIFAANLTPDKDTGLGNWTEEMFINAIRIGKHQGSGRHILPPMPWFVFALLPNKDLKAIFAYLKSLKPVNNPVPAPIPPTE
jgi:hypothetical protein